MSHYSIHRVDDGMGRLRTIFPEGLADDLNAVLFSTSGVHGTYCTIEDCEAGEVEDVTFLIVQHRLVCLQYGNCVPQTPEDFAFLKRLRASSWNEFQAVGRPAAYAKVEGQAVSDGSGASPPGSTKGSSAGLASDAQDARRYRWLRDRPSLIGWDWWVTKVPQNVNITPEFMDEAIDRAAMKGEQP